MNGKKITVACYVNDLLKHRLSAEDLQKEVDNMLGSELGKYIMKPEVPKDYKVEKGTIGEEYGTVDIHTLSITVISEEELTRLRKIEKQYNESGLVCTSCNGAGGNFLKGEWFPCIFCKN